MDVGAQALEVGDERGDLLVLEAGGAALARDVRGDRSRLQARELLGLSERLLVGDAERVPAKVLEELACRGQSRIRGPGEHQA